MPVNIPDMITCEVFGEKCFQILAEKILSFFFLIFQTLRMPVKLILPNMTKMTMWKLRSSKFLANCGSAALTFH